MTPAHPVDPAADSAVRDVHQQEIHAESGGTVYAVLHGNMYVSGEHAAYRFEPFPGFPRLLAAETPQPSVMPLSAEVHRQVLISWNEELAALAAWRDHPANGVSAMLAHGAVGENETRLAAWFAAGSAEGKWTVWSACRTSDSAARSAIAPGDPGRALVAIIECADRWPADNLQLLMQSPLLRSPRRTRVLLLARSVESWWPALRHRLQKAGITVGGTLALRRTHG